MQEQAAQSQEVQNASAAGRPTIAGTPVMGQTLTAGTAGISDPNGKEDAALAYQWLRDPGTGYTDISGATATAATYTVVTEDVGRQIKVQVSFTDDDGFDETVTSNPVYVEPPPPCLAASTPARCRTVETARRGSP